MISTCCRPAWVVSACALVLTLGIAPAAAAQRAVAPPQTERQLLAGGWAALSAGRAAEAQDVARRLLKLKGSRTSAAVITFVVEAALADAGPVEALRAYEAWLGGRGVEAAYPLRQIAAAALQAAAAGADSAARAEALHMLAADGNAEAREAAAKGVKDGQSAHVFAAAAAGDETAVAALVELVQSGRANIRATEALAESRHPRAVPVLIDILSRQDDDMRGPAAAALAAMGAREAIPALQALLAQPVGPLRFAAAAALLRLGDSSGLEVLKGAAASPHSGVRAGAAEALAGQPDAEWRVIVEDLAADPDPLIRLRAARLLVGTDPARATTLLESLRADENPAIRQLAARSLVAVMGDDLRVLRRLLGDVNATVRVRAAGRILALTR